MTPIADKTLILDNVHRLEYGASTWDEAVKSLRNRYDSECGRYDRVSSQEIPVSDLAAIIKYAASVRALGVQETVDCLKCLAESLLDRQQ